MALVEVRMDRIGSLRLWPVRARLRREIVREVLANGGPADEDVWLEGDDARSFLADLRARTVREIEAGWPTRLRMDAWLLRRYFGYCDR